MTKRAEHGRTFLRTHTVGLILYSAVYITPNRAHCSQLIFFTAQPVARPLVAYEGAGPL